MPYQTTPENAAAPSVTQTGEKNVYINQANDVYITLSVSASSAHSSQPAAKAPSFCREYYSLFVTEDEDFTSNSPFIVSHHHLLQKEMDPELTRKFSTLKASAIRELLTFPCIFARKNKNYGRADEKQFARLGFIRQIDNLRSGVRIYPELIEPPLSQQRLNELLQPLDLWGHEQINEFDDIHWSIKKADLFQVLLKAGFFI